MKSKCSTIASMLILMVFTTACGKKAVYEGSPANDQLTDPTTAEVDFHTFKSIKDSFEENDHDAFKKVILNNPLFDLNQLLHEGETFLTWSIKKDYREIRNFLIEKGVSLEKENVNGHTPLMVAVENGRLNSLQVLIDYKVSLEKTCRSRHTALLLAIRKNQDEIAMTLLKHGASIHATDRLGRDAYTLSQVFHVPQTYELIKNILALEVGAPDINTFKSLILAADSLSLEKLLKRYPQIAKDYVYEVINPLALLVTSENESSALKTAEVLLDYRANVNGPDNADYTPLIHATKNQKKAFTHLYLSAQANPQLIDKDGKSALIHAVENNNPDIVELLLAYSAVEKYTYRKDGKRVTFNSCTVARKTREKLSSPKDLEMNDRIKSSLNCGFFSWLF